MCSALDAGECPGTEFQVTTSREGESVTCTGLVFMPVRALMLCVQGVPRARLGHRHGLQHPTQPSCCPGAFPPKSAVAGKFILSLAAQMSRWVMKQCQLLWRCSAASCSVLRERRGGRGSWSFLLSSGESPFAHKSQSHGIGLAQTVFTALRVMSLL